MAVVIAPNRDMVSLALPIRSGKAARFPLLNRAEQGKRCATEDSRRLPMVNGPEGGSLRAG
jgi:hypothetical protein